MMDTRNTKISMTWLLPSSGSFLVGKRASEQMQYAWCYGLNCVPHPKFICWRPNPKYLRMWLYLQIRSLKSNETKIKLLWWALVQSDLYYKEKIWTHRETPGMHEHREEAVWGRNKKTAIDKLREEASMETKPPNTLILVIQSLELLVNKFLLFRHHIYGMWS